MKQQMTRKAAAFALTAAMMLTLLPGALAAPDKDQKKNNDNTGTGQTQVHIHGMSGLTDNKGTVTITVGDKEYTGTLNGSTLEIEMDSTDNGFDFDQGESMDIGYTTGSGASGTITLEHQEGNGTNIANGHDKGLNNFKGTIKPATPETTPDPTPETTPETTPDSTPETTPEVEIDEDPVPLAPEVPEAEPVIVAQTEPEVEIPEETVPLAPAAAEEPAEEPAEETVIVEDGVPLGDLPQTGAVAQAVNPAVTAGMLALAASLAAAGLGLSVSRKKEEE